MTVPINFSLMVESSQYPSKGTGRGVGPSGLKNQGWNWCSTTRLYTCKSFSEIVSISEEIKHTLVLLLTAIDNEKMVLIYNNWKILIHFFLLIWQKKKSKK
jgi:hypothetical protein